MRTKNARENQQKVWLLLLEREARRSHVLKIAISDESCSRLVFVAEHKKSRQEAVSECVETIYLTVHWTVSKLQNWISERSFKCKYFHGKKCCEAGIEREFLAARKSLTTAETFRNGINNEFERCITGGSYIIGTEARKFSKDSRGNVNRHKINTIAWSAETWR